MLKTYLVVIFILLFDTYQSWAQQLSKGGNSNDALQLADMLITKAILYREGISNGEFHFRCKRWSTTEGVADTEFLIKISGDRMRSHRWYKDFELVNCFGCYGDDFVSYSIVTDKNDPEVLRPLLTIRPFDRVDRHSDSELEPDPRLIGMLPNDYRSNARYKIRDIMFSSDEKYSVIDDQVGDQFCKKIEFKNDFGANVTCWLVPDKGFSFVQLEFRIDNAFYKAESSVTYCDTLKHWFPERVVSSFSLNGDEIETEELKVERAVIGNVVDSDFSIAGMNVAEPGTPVHWSISNRRPPSNLPLVWNGHEVTSKNRESQNGSRESKILKIVIANLGFLGLVVGTWLIWRARKT